MGRVVVQELVINKTHSEFKVFCSFYSLLIKFLGLYKMPQFASVWWYGISLNASDCWICNLTSSSPTIAIRRDQSLFQFQGAVRSGPPPPYLSGSPPHHSLTVELNKKCESLPVNRSSLHTQQSTGIFMDAVHAPENAQFHWWGCWRTSPPYHSNMLTTPTWFKITYKIKLAYVH